MDSKQVKKRIAIIGAGGRIGSSAARFLLARHCEVRVIGRRAEPLAALAEAGALSLLGDLQDTRFLQTAINGCDGVLASLPGWDSQKEIRRYLNDLGVSVFTACLFCKTPRVVNISDYSVRFQSAGEYPLGMQDQERRLNMLPESHVAHLRPAFYLPNLHQALDDVFFSTPKGGAPLIVPLAEEIGEIAATLLYEGKFSGKSIVELASADYTPIRNALEGAGQPVQKSGTRGG